MIEFEDLRQLDDHLARGLPLAHCAFQHLDLRAHTPRLTASSLEGALFLGCQLAPESLLHASRCGALVFPDIPGLPFKPYRPRLYSVEELYAGYQPSLPGSYALTPDARVYAYFSQARERGTSLLDTLAQRLHDQAITDALEEFLHQRRVIAIMGGHRMRRDAPLYAQVVRLAAELTRRGFLVASGGGPGAMEAANLGAWLSTFPDSVQPQALDILAKAPLYTPTEPWLQAAFEVRARFSLEASQVLKSHSLAIPTWHYGHEPPNAFASHVAKYFENSVREEGLLAIATYGVIFSPGSAGTIQEIFQDACQNHYQVFGTSPMVFLDSHYWNNVKPVFPLLEQLAQGQQYARWLQISDNVDEVLLHLEDYARQPALAAPRHVA